MDFLELRQVLSTYDGDLRDPLWWLQERPVPMELLGGPSGFLSRRCWGLRPCVESAPPCWWALRQPCSSQPGCSPVIQKPEP